MQNGNGAKGIWKVITASSAGTLIEWYDFYIFGSLAVTLTPAFFPKSAQGLLQILGIFAAGFVVRPFGAILFGRLGDVIGRKHTFLLTLLLMGGSTFAIGLLPTYAQVGFFAPALLLALRLIQGLALGGEYGGAATYVAEHAPDGRRGFYTSFIQTTATLGLFISLGVILAINVGLKPADFDAWGWRIPFLLSVVLVVFSYSIRRRMAESPMFAQLKSEGKTAKNPLKESFGNPANRRLVLLALFGATAGQGVVWYTGQFYALYYLQTVLNINKISANIIIGAALLLGTPLFVVFGGLSDRVGRKKIIIAGCALAAVLYVPIYAGMVRAADLSQATPVSTSIPKVEQKPDKETKEPTTVTTTVATYDQGTTVKTTVTDHVTWSPTKDKKVEKKTDVVPGATMIFALSFLVLLQVVFVAMVYGPIAAFLVELFPTRIRYTSLSVPYHIGNGIFGGLVPLIGKSLEAGVHKYYGGLIYPIVVALMTAFIGGFLIRERRDVKLWEETPSEAVVDMPEQPATV